MWKIIGNSEHFIVAIIKNQFVPLPGLGLIRISPRELSRYKYRLVVNWLMFAVCFDFWKGRYE